jgi:hypothetical protein
VTRGIEGPDVSGCKNPVNAVSIRNAWQKHPASLFLIVDWQKNDKRSDTADLHCASDNAR